MITEAGKDQSDFKASWTPDSRRSWTHPGAATAKVFSILSEWGLRAGDPAGPAHWEAAPSASRGIGPATMREVVLGPAGHSMPRTERARDLCGRGALVPGLRTPHGRTDLRDRGGGPPHRKHRPAQDRSPPPEGRGGHRDRRADLLVERLRHRGDGERF